MNIVIGVRDSARELPLEIDIDEAALVRTIEHAIASGGVVSCLLYTSDAADEL